MNKLNIVPCSLKHSVSVFFLKQNVITCEQVWDENDLILLRNQKMRTWGIKERFSEELRFEPSPVGWVRMKQ